MKKVVVLAVLVAAMAVPSAFATAELTLQSGASTVDILDGGSGDSCPAAGCVTYIGSVGSWSLNITSGIEGTTPFFDLVSFDTTTAQVDPIVMYFSDDGLTLPSGFDLNVGGTVSSTSKSAPTVEFGAWSGGPGKFDFSNPIGSILTFHATPFSGSTSGATLAGESSVTIGAYIDLGERSSGSASFDAALDSVPEPASVSMLGGVLLILGGALRRRIKKA